MNELLAIIISLLVYPGLLFGLVAAMAFGWLRGIIRAWSMGWSNLAPTLSLREVARRLRQGSTLPDGTYAPAMIALPVIALVCPLVVLVFLPLPGNRGAGVTDYTLDIAAAGALLLGVPVVRTAIGWLTPSPYTRIAAMRSARQLIGYLVPLTLALASIIAISTFSRFALATGYQSIHDANLNGLLRAGRILAGLAYLTCLPALARITPIREGQGAIELVGSELTEMSGRELMVMRVAESIQFVAVIGVGVTLFVLPFFATDGARGIAAIISAIVLTIGLGLWEGLGAQLRQREDFVTPYSIWFGAQTFFGILAVLTLVLAQRIGPAA